MAYDVRTPVFEGPFDLLLHLISKHKLELTELALHAVTDDFIAYIADQGAEWNLDETTEFLVIAATLLDLKAAQLLPNGEVEDEGDLAVLEARDLLFARLLQYRAFKDVAGELASRMAAESRWHPRRAALPEPFASLLPEVLLAISPERLAEIAAAALTPRVQPQVGTGHLHAPAVSVREQAILVAERVRQLGVCSFRTLVQDAPSTAHVVARFLALLELYREQTVTFEQAAALGELHVRWLSGASIEDALNDADEFDSTSGEGDD